MNFITFSTSSTTIFPMANSTTGSQMLTEYNLRVRDSVATDSSISYMSCPSYTHSIDDFYVRIQEDDSGAITDSYVLEILPGKAMINGHFVENTESMTVDLIAANNELASMSLNALSGNLAIGIRAYYSTEESMSGAITEVEEQSLFQGVQLVVLPEKELLTPLDSPDDKNKVTCHLKLASFDFINNVISNVKQNNDKIQYIQGERIGNIDDMISTSYISSNGLNAKKLYTYSGRGTSEHDTWCDSTGSLMVWDNAPVKTTTKPTQTEAGFSIDANTDAIELVVPHQQIDGMINSVGSPEYYQNKSYPIPVASYSKNTPGTVNGAYAKSIKEVENKFNNFYRLPGDGRQLSFDYQGKQLQFIPIYDPEGTTDGETFSTLPPVNQVSKNGVKYWNIGDYIVVKEDRTFTETDGTELSYPSTFYAVIPGKVINYSFYNTSTVDQVPTDTDVTPLKGTKLDGVELARIVWGEDSPPQTRVQVTEMVTQGLKHGNIMPQTDSNGNVYYATLTFPNASPTLEYPLMNSIEEVDPETKETITRSMGYVNAPSITPVKINEANLNIVTGEFKNLQNSDIIANLVNDDLSYIDSCVSNLNQLVNSMHTQLVSASDSADKIDTYKQYVVDRLVMMNNNATGILNHLEDINAYEASIEEDAGVVLYYESPTDNNSSRRSAQAATNITNAAKKIKASRKSISQNTNAIIKYINESMTKLDGAQNSIDISVDDIKEIVNNVYNSTSNSIMQIESVLSEYKLAIQDKENSDIARLLNMQASYIYAASISEGIIADYQNYNGYAYHDYFTVVYTDDNGNTTYYYYMVTSSEPNTWSTPSLITPSLPLADIDTIGGFRNIDASDIEFVDGGYVTLNDDGNLQLVDYSLLRSGVAAYQLGQDLTYESGTTIEDIQNFLDEYVNDRITFPNTEQLVKSSTPNIINIYITLPEDAEDKSNPLIIKNIDSRFNTSVFFHFSIESEDSSVSTGVTINIMDCEKIRLDSDITGKPIINLYRSNLYYDSEVLNYIAQCGRTDYTFTGMEDISFWYEMFESTDPDLVVNDMTITQVNTPIITEDVDYWNTTTPNDNHYMTALKSITFSSDGLIMGCEILVANQSTDNVRTGQKLLVGEFELPQGRGLTYPKSCLAKQMKITGTFSSCYYTSGYWAVSTTNFSALTQSYSIIDLTQTGVGSIAFNTNTTLVEADLGETIEQGGIPPFESDSYHIFTGGVIS